MHQWRFLWFLPKISCFFFLVGYQSFFTTIDEYFPKLELYAQRSRRVREPTVPKGVDFCWVMATWTILEWHKTPAWWNRLALCAAWLADFFVDPRDMCDTWWNGIWVTLLQRSCSFVENGLDIWFWYVGDTSVCHKRTKHIWIFPLCVSVHKICAEIHQQKT